MLKKIIKIEAVDSNTASTIASFYISEEFFRENRIAFVNVKSGLTNQRKNTTKGVNFIFREIDISTGENIKFLTAPIRNNSKFSIFHVFGDSFKNNNKGVKTKQREEFINQLMKHSVVVANEISDSGHMCIPKTFCLPASQMKELEEFYKKISDEQLSNNTLATFID